MNEDNKNKNYVALDKKHVWHPFTQELTAPDPILIKSAKGSILYKENGEEVLDLVSSWWVNIHGHANEKIVKALQKQAETMEHVIFAGFTHKPAIELSERITKILPEKLERVFFSDNGSTAVEIALKLSLQYWFNKGESNRKRIIAFNNSYHGDTFGAMSVAKESGFYEPFEDKLFHVDFINYPSTYMYDDENNQQTEEQCLKEFTTLLEKTAKDTSAIIVEPLIQGAGGMNMMSVTYLQKMVRIAKSYNILVIFDEVMVGFGRTGDIFACNKAKVEPDLICLSKGLTGGFLPMALTVATEKIYEAFLDEDFNRAFAHGHSFTANPLGCAVALASLDITLSPATMENLKRIENLHKDRLEEARTLKNVENIRLCGTIGALDVIDKNSGYTSPVGTQLKEFYWKNNIHLRPLGNVVYMLPPYCTTNDQLNKGWDILLQGIRGVKISQ